MFRPTRASPHSFIGLPPPAFPQGGKTKAKIARVAGAQVEVNEHDRRVEIRGAQLACDRANEYVKMVLDQRVGPVHIDMDTERPDMTVVTVPRDCVGYVTGRGGAVLRNLEEEWGTLMFFAKDKSGSSGSDIERLAIFGKRRARRGAELKVMSAVEHKTPVRVCCSVLL